MHFGDAQLFSNIGRISVFQNSNSVKVHINWSNRIKEKYILAMSKFWLNLQKKSLNESSQHQ
jgi:hypothetical protein